MSDWAIDYEGRNFATLGYTGSNSYLNALTAHASANTKGSYTELSSATPFAATQMIVMVRYADYTYDYLIDIAIGAAGSEAVIVNNLYYGVYNDGRHTNVCDYCFPINIPKGVRLSARVQASTGGKTVGVGVMLFSGRFNQCLNGVDTYGANTADSGGVSVDPGGAANTKGNWVELTSATDRSSQGIVLAFGGKLNTLFRWGEWRVDIGVGGAGSENVVVSDFNLTIGNVNGILAAPKCSPFMPVSIPKGSRVAVRSQSSITDATDRLFDTIAYLIC
jgi:hypothetical protein